MGRKMATTELTIFTAVLAALTSSGFISLVLYYIQRRDRLKDAAHANETAQSRMLLGLGHDKIMHLTDKYVKRGAITLKEKRNLQFLWEPYADMNGNGDCKIGYKACQDLLVVSEERAEELDLAMKRKDFKFDDDER